jgi:hypothetical protein
MSDLPIQEDDDVERMVLLKEALVGQGALVFEVCRGESEEPEEAHHAYVLAPSVSEWPIFACVLVSPGAIERMEQEAPGAPSCEGFCWFQPIEGDSPEALRAGLSRWVKRNWPDSSDPTIVVRERLTA